MEEEKKKLRREERRENLRGVIAEIRSFSKESEFDIEEYVHNREKRPPFIYEEVKEYPEWQEYQTLVDNLRKKKSPKSREEENSKLIDFRKIETKTA